MIAVALVDLRRTFGLDFTTASWLIGSYYLASAVGQPVLGRVGDVLGRRRVFLAGLGVVAVASIAAPLAPTFGWLVAARVLQALGTSALFPSGVGIVRATFGPGQARALGVLSVFASVSAGVGPTLGGYLVGWSGWPAIFLVNLPIVAVSAVLAWRSLPRDHGEPGAWARLDQTGAVLFSGGLLGGLWFLMSLSGRPAWAGLAAAVVLGTLFVHRELRMTGPQQAGEPVRPLAPEPFMGVRALGANRRLVAVYGGNAVVNVVFYAVFFGVPSYLQQADGRSPEQAGVIMLPLAALGVLSTPVLARVIERWGARPVLVGGGAALVLACVGLLFVTPSWSGWAMAGLLGVLGVANGATGLSLQVAMYDAAPKGAAGAASGLFQTSRYLGTILATTALAIAFGQVVDTARLHALASGLVVLAGVLTLGAVALGRRRAD